VPHPPHRPQAYGIAYPKMYAEGDSEAAFKFNSVQRAHQNLLENLPLLLAVAAAAATAAGPRVAAGLLAVWTLGRVLYFKGYAANG